MKKNYTILSIDTSCDETAVAVTRDDRVLSNVIFSQVAIHKKWGGVVPMLAKRAHEERIDRILSEALIRAQVKIEEIDAVAVTYGPGLAPALEVGVRKAKQVAREYNKSLIAVNHMEGHLLSAFAKNSQGKGSQIADYIDSHLRGNDKELYPLLALLISGGHTELVVVNAIGEYQLIGETLDDAIGEAYDKVAKLLDLGYPGGPIIEHLANQGDELAYDLPIPMKGRDDYDFSYSGLKTAVRYLVDGIKKEGSLNKKTIADIAASFQRVATASLINRLERAVNNIKPYGLLIGGGVISNLYVRNQIRTSMKSFNVPVYIPYSKKLITDNAAMIGNAAYHQAKRGEFVSDVAQLDRNPSFSFSHE